ncbi:hypothetical protein SHELI_v1c06020 [Spiroplasma helicoides]|uniref:Uncharacterized protein n=1 Tax=Spiroplasma helicoides TaxID=216938 RepID=A0A1B3SKV9_9MOLU|nr:hypothetical protein [Spiroplasma helicoides]AOG60553.1 hypothetical protein SHELI_v1c06020 [Spiroplasma helicoides]
MATRHGIKIEDYGLPETITKRIEDLFELNLNPSTMNLLTSEFSVFDEKVKNNISRYIAEILLVENEVLDNQMNLLKKDNFGSAKQEMILKQRKSNLIRLQQILVSKEIIITKPKSKVNNNSEKVKKIEKQNQAVIKKIDLLNIDNALKLNLNKLTDRKNNLENEIEQNQKSIKKLKKDLESRETELESINNQQTIDDFFSVEGFENRDRKNNDMLEKGIIDLKDKINKIEISLEKQNKELKQLLKDEEIELKNISQTLEKEEKLAKEKELKEKQEQEKLAKEKDEQEKKQKEIERQEKIAKQKELKEKKEQEKLAKEKKEQEKLAKEKKEQEKLQIQKNKNENLNKEVKSSNISSLADIARKKIEINSTIKTYDHENEFGINYEDNDDEILMDSKAESIFLENQINKLLNDKEEIQLLIKLQKAREIARQKEEERILLEREAERKRFDRDQKIAEAQAREIWKNERIIKKIKKNSIAKDRRLEKMAREIKYIAQELEDLKLKQKVEELRRIEILKRKAETSTDKILKKDKQKVDTFYNILERKWLASNIESTLFSKDKALRVVNNMKKKAEEVDKKYGNKNFKTQSSEVNKENVINNYTNTKNDLSDTTKKRLEEFIFRLNKNKENNFSETLQSSIQKPLDNFKSYDKNSIKNSFNKSHSITNSKDYKEFLKDESDFEINKRIEYLERKKSLNIITKEEIKELENKKENIKNKSIKKNMNLKKIISLS